MNPEKPQRNALSRLPLIAFAALPLTVGLVFAQQTATPTTPQQVTPVQPGQRAPTTPGTAAQTGTNYADVFLQKLAAGLGITVEKLRSAAISAGSSTIDQGVKAGDLPSDRAAQMKQDLQTHPFAFAGGAGRRGMRGDHGGHLGSGPAVTAAVARTLGLSEQDLITKVQAGQTITQLAQSQGVSTAAVHDAAVAALKTQLASDVQAGRLTQAQADQVAQRAQADANFGLQMGGPGLGGRGDHRGRGGFDGQDGPRGFGGQDDPGAQDSQGRGNSTPDGTSQS